MSRAITIITLNGAGFLLCCLAIWTGLRTGRSGFLIGGADVDFSRKSNPVGFWVLTVILAFGAIALGALTVYGIYLLLEV